MVALASPNAMAASTIRRVPEGPRHSDRFHAPVGPLTVEQRGQVRRVIVVQVGEKDAGNLPMIGPNAFLSAASVP